MPYSNGRQRCDHGVPLTAYCHGCSGTEACTCRDCTVETFILAEITNMDDEYRELCEQ